MKRVSSILAIILIMSLFAGCGSTTAAGDIYCWKCGKQISNDSIYCRYCGAEINRQEQKPKQSAEADDTDGADSEQGIPSDTSATYLSYEDNPFAWTDIKQYYACGSGESEFVIALDMSGEMHACTTSSDAVDIELINTIRSEGWHIRQFYPIYNTFGLMIAAVRASGSLVLFCNEEYYKEMCQKAEIFTDVVSVAFGCDDCGGPLSVCVLLADGTVKSTNDSIDRQVKSWKGVAKIFGMYNESYLGIKSDGTCVGIGPYFEEDAILYGSPQLNASEWKDVEDAHIYMAPMGLNMFLIRRDGSVLSNRNSIDDRMSNAPILQDIVSLNHDTDRNNSLFALDKDGVCSSYPITWGSWDKEWSHSGIKSVGTDGLCIDRDGKIISGAFNGTDGEVFSYVICSGFGETDTDTGARLKSIDYAANSTEDDGRYWALTEDGYLRLIRTNQVLQY